MQTHSHTRSHHGAVSVSIANPPTGMFWKVEGNQGTLRIQIKLHTDGKPRIKPLEFNQKPWWCEASMLHHADKFLYYYLDFLCIIDYTHAVF